MPTAQADTIYPDNKITGTSFDAGLDGWSVISNRCTVLLGLVPTEEPLTCNTRTTHEPGFGAPAGSLQQDYQPPADGLAPLLFNATPMARSSSFTIGPNGTGASGATTFQFDRRADVQAILDGDSRATYTFTLVDETVPSRTELFRETLNDSDNVFRGQLNDAAPAVVAGHTYHIELSTLFNTAILSVALQKTIANFDNIRLRVVDGTPTFGEPGAVTDPATAITATSATLNGRVNARGLPTTFVYRYGTNETGTLPSNVPATGPPFDGGELQTFVPRPRGIAGLTACTTYHFEIEATNSQGTTTGSRQSFSTACKPTVKTLVVSGVGPDGATFTSRINPRSLETKYFYEYGTVAGGFSTRTPAAGEELVLAAGSSDVAPNSYPVGGLTKQTQYQVRIVASNSSGSSTGDPVVFTTPGTGETGSTGSTGSTGATGGLGRPGGPGGPGPQGPKGPTPTVGQSFIQNLLSTDARAMIRVDSKRIRVPMKGRNIGRVRIAVYCRRVAVKTCFGNVKVRTTAKINPASRGRPAKAKRRVTWDTDDVQLDVGKKGFAILDFNAQRRGVLERTGSIRSMVIISVIDARNNRQNIRASLTVVPGKK